MSIQHFIRTQIRNALRLSLAALVGLTPGLFTQSISAEEAMFVSNELRKPEAPIYVDSWWTPGGDSGSQLDVHLQIPAAALVFTTAEDGTLVANYGVDVILIDAEDEVVTERIQRASFYATSHAQTQSSTMFQHLKVSLPAPEPGSYTAKMIIVDESSRHEADIILPIEVTASAGSTPAMSDILLSHSVHVETPAGWETAIMPHPQKRFGADDPALFFYVEVNNGSAETDSASFTATIEGMNGLDSTVVRQKLRVRGKRPVFSRINTADLPPGNYVLKTECRIGNDTIVREERFTVAQSLLDLRFRPFAQIVDELELIASHEEIASLHETPDSLHGEALAMFWLRRDPTIHSIENEARSEFYRRISLARAIFAEEETITDKGQVFIVFGMPDRVSHESTFHGIREIWHYASHSINAVFQDDMGLGRYHLINRRDVLN